MPAVQQGRPETLSESWEGTGVSSHLTSVLTRITFAAVTSVRGGHLGVLASVALTPRSDISFAFTCCLVRVTWLVAPNRGCNSPRGKKDSVSHSPHFLYLAGVPWSSWCSSVYYPFSSSFSVGKLWTAVGLSPRAAKKS